MTLPEHTGAPSTPSGTDITPVSRLVPRALLGDRLLLAAAAVFATFAALYMLPVLSDASLEQFVANWADPILILLAVVAFQHGKGPLRREERMFWNLLTASFVCYSGGVWLGLLVPSAEWGVVEASADDLLFLLQFVFTFLAISLNPHARDSDWDLAGIRFRLESIGTVTFATLIAFYFVFIPIHFGDADTVPPRAMFVAVDPLLVFSFLYAASVATSRRWRAVYRLLGYVWMLWLASDVVELLTAMGVVPEAIPYGTAYDFLWFAPFALAVLAARIARQPALIAEEESTDVHARRARRLRYMFGPLVVYTTSLPLIHFALSALGAIDPATRGPREVGVFFGLLLLGSMTLLNEKLIDRQRRRAEQENKRLAAFPIKNPNPFLTFSGDGRLKYLNPAASRTMKALEIETIEEFVPAKHSELVADCMITRSGYRDIEVAVNGHVFSFGYYPNPSGDDVFVYVMDITERKQAEGKLKYDALHDTLTGLPNRTLVMEILSRAIERARRDPDYRFALLFLDLNRFKLVNDSLGHLAGDRFLVEISKRLERCLRKNDVVGRFGGDEFVIILDAIKNVNQATRAAARLQRELCKPLTLNDQEIVTSACIGIAMSDGDRSRPEDYLRDADIAMYRAKTQGANGFEVFDQDMHDDAIKQLQLENQLRHAIDRDELILYYQPYVSLVDGRIVGFEALLRWNHPEIGMVPPGEFIPLAEDVGLIVPIGWWVIEQACARLQRWSPMVEKDAKFTISVNVSTRQLREHGFCRRLHRVLERYDIDRSQLCLEITESVMTDLGEGVISLLERVKSLGVRLAVDDFGTGYSSLSYLRKFPVDVLKIDRSFIRDLDATRQDVAIVRAITTLAENLELSAIAEGVETLAQANRLRALGCRVAQGYLFSMPVHPDRAEEILHAEVLTGEDYRAAS